MGLDLLRPYLGPGLFAGQWAAGGLALLALRLRLRDRPSARSPYPWALAVLLLGLVVGHSRRLASDGIHYFAYWRSLVFDGDLAFANDYALLGWGHPDPRNVLPLGAPLLWSPLLLAVHAARQSARLLGWPAPTGVEPVYQAAACLATCLWGGAGLLLLHQTLGRFVAPAAAFWATLVAWLGSPLRFYLSVLPGLAHGVEFFAGVLVLRAYLSLRDRPEPRSAAWAGAACGLAFLTRSQDGLLLALPALEIAWRAATGRREWRRWMRCLAALGAGFLLAALPQVLAWQAVFGVPVLIPHRALHGADFLRLDRPELAGALVSARGGLLTSHPALLLGLLGLLGLLRRHGRYVVLVAPVLGAMWYLNASVFDWYHVRRYTGLVPLLAPGLAGALAPLTRAGLVAPGLLTLFFWRYDVAVDAHRRVPGDPAPVQSVLRETSDGVAEEVFALTERAWPSAAARLLSAYTGQAVLEGAVSELDLGRDDGATRLPRRARHLSAVEWEDGRPVRWVTDRSARLYLAVARPAPAVLTVEARALETAEPQTLQALWNGEAVGEAAMTPAWSSYRFHLREGLVRAGVNELELRFARGPIYRRVRGAGPREVRPAALARLLFHRGRP